MAYQTPYLLNADEKVDYDKKLILHNQLLNGLIKLDKTQASVLSLALSKVESRIPASDQRDYIRIHARELIQFGHNEKSIYRDLLKAARGLRANELYLSTNAYSMNNKKVTLDTIRVLSWLSDFSFPRMEEERHKRSIALKKSAPGNRFIINSAPWVDVRFHEILRHEGFLYDLKQCFTQIPFLSMKVLSHLNKKEGLKFNSNTRVIYSWGLRELGLGNTTFFLRFDAMLEQLALSLHVDKRYSWPEFRRNILVPAQEQINLLTDLSIKIETVREGRQACGASFSITRKRVIVDGAQSFEIEKTHAQRNAAKALFTPTRPRLPSLSKSVRAKSHDHGEWARKVISILTAYEEELECLDLSLPRKDIEKIVNCYELIGNRAFANKYKKKLKLNSSS